MDERLRCELGTEVYDARVWYFSVRRVCAQLVHFCGVTPPRVCVPCVLTVGHDGTHDAFADPTDDEIVRQYRERPTSGGRVG